ncbi:nuclear transport factor 2 family protein [Krasilnikovia sp. M28-CT-15]|uniref:nuclear transport factor 2 family protein n=1 Tax=Krasilnikovia sp. M28-CT-15 TaxID=3373540 RepID=UPI003876008C
MGDGNVGQEFLATQVQLLEAGDTAGLAQRYAEDAEFVRLDKVVRGRTEIKELFDAYLEQQPNIEQVEAAQITDDTVLYQARERLGGREVWAVGTLIFVDGQVWRQSVAFIDRDQTV